ncbi:MAG: hypothetical protein ACP5OG_02500 [Candidatus Nanoarchaeia archaeon]
MIKSAKIKPNEQTKVLDGLAESVLNDLCLMSKESLPKKIFLSGADTNAYNSFKEILYKKIIKRFSDYKPVFSYSCPISLDVYSVCNNNNKDDYNINLGIFLARQ